MREANVIHEDLIDARQLCAMTGLTMSALRGRLDRGTIPNPASVVDRKHYWSRRTIAKWANSRHIVGMPPYWPPGKQVVTVHDIAAVLKKSPNAIRIMVSRGKMPQPTGYRSGRGRVLWDREVIEPWIDEFRKQQDQEMTNE